MYGFFPEQQAHLIVIVDGTVINDRKQSVIVNNKERHHVDLKLLESFEKSP